MLAAANLAGFLTAHSISTLHTAGSVSPILGFRNDNESISLERLISEKYEESKKVGSQKLAANKEKYKSGVLVYDGYLTTPDEERINALITDFINYDTDETATFAIPFYPDKTNKRFQRVSNMKFGNLKVVLFPSNYDETKISQLSASFFEGMETHSNGIKVYDTNHI